MCFELLTRGYDAATGKVGNEGVDFIAAKADEKPCVQVTKNMNAPETGERELEPLRQIPDSREKIVIAPECGLPMTRDGIKFVKLPDFLLS